MISSSLVRHHHALPNQQNMDYPSFKLVLVGDGGTGKTTSVKRHLTGEFEKKYEHDGILAAESDSGEYWVLFGGFAPIGKKVASDNDIIPETTPAKLYSITGGKVNHVEGEFSKSQLENNKCYLLDCGAEVFLWVGRVTQVDERKSSSQAAEEYVTSENRPNSARITRVIQGYETHSFNSNFDS